MKEKNIKSNTKRSRGLAYKATSALLAASLLVSTGGLGYSQYFSTNNVAQAANENYNGVVTFVTKHGNVQIKFTNGNQRLDQADEYGRKVNFGDYGHGTSKAYFIGLSDTKNYAGTKGKFVYKHEPIKNLFPNGLKGGEVVHASYLDATAAFSLNSKIDGQIEINRGMDPRNFLFNNLNVKEKSDNTAKKEITYYTSNKNENSKLNLEGVSFELNPFLMAIARYSPTHYYQPGTLEHYPTTNPQELNDPNNKNYTYVDLHVQIDKRVKLNNTLDFNFTSYSFKPHMVLNKNKEKIDANFTIANGNPSSRVTFNSSKVTDSEFILRVRLRSEQEIPNATVKDISEDSKITSNKDDNFILPKEEITKISEGKAKPIEIKGYIDGWAKLYQARILWFKIGGSGPIPRKDAQSLVLNFAYNKVKFNKNSSTLEKAEQDLGLVNVINGNTIDGDSLNSGTKPAKNKVGDSMPADLSNIVANGKTYKFKEWNTSADGRGQKFTGSTTVTKDQTVYAIWEEKAEEQHIKINENGKVATKDGHAIFNIGSQYYNSVKDLEYGIYSDTTFKTKSAKNANVTWKVEAVAGFEKYRSTTTAASNMFEKTTTVYEGNKLNVNRIKALRSGVYKVTASINGGQSSDYIYAVVPGDVDRNGDINNQDADKIKKYYETGKIDVFKYQPDEFTLTLADLDQNKIIDLNDATIVKNIYTEILRVNRINI